MSNLDLEKFDGQCVRITDDRGDVFDGICTYNSDEYNEHVFGECEDGLDLVYMIFYRSQIKDVQSLEDHTGPYGKFLDPYGKLEELAVEDGIDGIEEILFCDYNEHVMRMLRCLESHIQEGEFPYSSETVSALTELIDYTDDEEIKKEAQRLLDICNPKS